MERQNRQWIWPSGRPKKLARRPFFGGAVGPFWQRTLWREGRKEGGIDVSGGLLPRQVNASGGSRSYSRSQYCRCCCRCPLRRS